MIRRTAYSIGLAFLLALAGCPAFAGEGEGGSPAERLFRDAYWAETTRGALDEARDGYRKASEAEGPDAVKARALYRLAVVLERMERTGEAIRVLESLAKAHPDETELQAKARTRLTEWTAIDLRTGFTEWYRRYLYSPEFQARIVEHVHALSAEAKSGPAADELLTIGEPAVPALEAHLESPNVEMRDRVVDILLRMGRVPHPRHLLNTRLWMEQPANWSRLLALPAEGKAELRAKVEADTPKAKTLRAVLDDRTRWPDALRYSSNARLLDAILDQPMDDALRDGLLALVGTFTGNDVRQNGRIAQALLERRLVPESVAYGWLKEGPRDLQELVLDRVTKGDLTRTRYLDAVLSLMASLGPANHLQNKVELALVRLLDDLPLDAVSWERLTRVYLGSLGPYVQLPSRQSHEWARARPEPMRRLLVEIVERAADPNVASSALDNLVADSHLDSDVPRRLLAWAADERLDPKLRERAVRHLGELVTGETLDGTLEALGRLPSALAEDLLHRLARNRKLQALPWTDERLLRLMDFFRRDGGRLQREGWELFQKLHEPRYRLENTVRLALREPARAWSEALADRRKELQDVARAIVHAELPDAWGSWSSEEREAALHVLAPYLHGSVPGVSEPDGLVPFFRAQLHAGDTPPAVRKLLAARLPRGGASLEDVRTAYDLDDPDEALAAALGLYGRYPQTLATYEALAAARRAANDDERFRFYTLWLQSADPQLERRAARDLLEDPKVEHRQAALVSLAAVRTAEDTPLFTKALSDPSPLVRQEAAKHLARHWNDEALAALVETLDDPDPAVRDQVLATLESIKEIEEKKEYWRSTLQQK